MSEVIRSAIESIDIGQTEAALALGFSEKQALFGVVVPQALKNSLPVFGNYLVMIVKDTSLLSYVALPEMLLITNDICITDFPYNRRLYIACRSLSSYKCSVVTDS